MTLIAFNFKFFYCLNKINLTNKLLKRFDYKKVLLNKIILLSTLQNKLTLLIIKNLLISLTQSEQKNLYIKIFLLLILILNIVIVLNKTFLSNIKKQLYINFVLMF